jgi:hypothetical protein
VGLPLKQEKRFGNPIGLHTLTEVAQMAEGRAALGAVVPRRITPVKRVK